MGNCVSKKPIEENNSSNVKEKINKNHHKTKSFRIGL